MSDQNTHTQDKPKTSTTVKSSKMTTRVRTGVRGGRKATK